MRFWLALKRADSQPAEKTVERQQLVESTFGGLSTAYDNASAPVLS